MIHSMCLQKQMTTHFEVMLTFAERPILQVFVVKLVSLVVKLTIDVVI
jgi:hypothetical protein